MKTVLTSFAILFMFSSYAQEFSGKLFLHWGYNRSAFTKSDIHFKGDYYDFTIKDAVATDRPTTFNTKIYFNPTLFTIPQYVYRIGYFVNDKMSISLGMDHMKYVLSVPSEAKLSGRIEKIASSKYVGTYSDEPILLSPDFVRFEHSDGLNYLSTEVDFRHQLFAFAKNKFSVDIMGGGGLGTYIPKTRVSIFNSELDNKFHLAGMGFSVHSQLRLYFKNTIYLTTGGKLGTAFLWDVLVDGSDARANHNFGWAQYYAAIGGQFYLHKRSKKDHVDAE